MVEDEGIHVDKVTVPAPREAAQEALPAVKDAWFQDFLTGNLMWPRELTPGVSTFTAAALLEDPSLDWDSFYKSQLSSDQTQQLGDIMNFEHEKAMATRYTDGYQTQRMQPPLTDDDRGPGIPPSANRAVWQGNKKYVVEHVLGIIDPTHQPKDFSQLKGDTLIAAQQGELADNIARLDALWKDPENAEIINRAKITAQAAKTALTEKEPREWSYLYRLASSKNLSPKKQEIYIDYAERYRDALTNTGKTELPEPGNINPTDLVSRLSIGQACLALARTQVASTIAANRANPGR